MKFDEGPSWLDSNIMDHGDTQIENPLFKLAEDMKIQMVETDF